MLSFNDEVNDGEVATIFMKKKSKLSQNIPIVISHDFTESLREAAFGGSYNADTLNDLKKSQQQSSEFKKSNQSKHMKVRFEEDEDIQVLSGYDAEKLEQINEMENEDKNGLLSYSDTLLHTQNSAQNTDMMASSILPKKVNETKNERIYMSNTLTKDSDISSNQNNIKKFEPTVSDVVYDIDELWENPRHQETCVMTTATLQAKLNLLTQKNNFVFR